MTAAGQGQLVTPWIMHDLLDHYIDGLVQDCINSSALAMELLQSCTKLSSTEYGWQSVC